MRITNNFIQNNALAQLQSNLKQISGAQQKVSTGLRMQKASDDPTGASRAMQARGGIRALDQYRRNIDMAKSKTSTEDMVLQRLTDVLTRAKELAVGQGGANASPATRAAAKVEIDELLSMAVQLGNTKYGDEYLFGGQWADQPPFELSQDGMSPLFTALDPGTGLPRTPSGAPQTEISAGRYATATHDGEEVFLNSGMLSALKELSDALVDPGDAATRIQQSIGTLDQSFDAIQTLVGEVGARTNQLEVTAANLTAFEINLKTLKSEVEEVDLEQAVTDLVSRQTTFQSAMLATSRVMGLTLADYLR